MTHKMKGLISVSSIWPDTDYFSFVPTIAPSSEAWERTGYLLGKTIVVELLRHKANEHLLPKLEVDSAIKEIEYNSCLKFTNEFNDYLNFQQPIKKQKNSERQECATTNNKP